jgi:Phosphate-starvation-inducible E family
MFGAVAILLYLVGFILIIRSSAGIYALITGTQADVIAGTATFLDIILLVLMIAEIAYTVALSVRGEVLRPMPFLIVGVIAVIRRLLVSSVQEVQAHGAARFQLISPGTAELAVLAGVILVFVIAMRLLMVPKPAAGATQTTHDEISE